MSLRLWQRIKDFVRWLLRRPPAPGHYEAGAKLSMHGWIASAPLVWPRREYLVYVPRGRRWSHAAPLLVLCHGCKQTPEDIAESTRITALADREGWLVLLPRQKREANAWCCWNWFDARTVAGGGEAAILAAQIEDVVDTYRADAKRVIVAGMSAGGALAAVMGLRHPGLTRAVVAHSALACGAASSAATAMRVMKHGPDVDVVSIAALARSAAPTATLPVPLLVIHGDADDIVSPVNAAALVRQYLELNGHPAVEGEPMASTLPRADDQSTSTDSDGRIVTTCDWRAGGRLIVRRVSIAGLGHAWSGGDARFAFNDAAAPDAGMLIAAFARSVAT